jgi:hypothetical protein
LLAAVVEEVTVGVVAVLVVIELLLEQAEVEHPQNQH